MLFVKHKSVTALFLVCALIYILQTVLTKPDPSVLAKYSLTAAQAVFLGLTVALPYVIIWVIALVGYLRLKIYTDSITDGKDGVAFRTITQGILVLALWLPLSGAVNSLVTVGIHYNPMATSTLTQLNNYLNLITLFPAFVLLNRGAKQLVGITRSASQAPTQQLIICYIIFAALYMLIVLSDPARRWPTHDSTLAAYYQPDWLLTITIIIPRLIMWFLGVQAVQNIYYYTQKVRGSIYKASLNRLSVGLGAVVLASIVLRFVQSASSQLGRLSLGVLLLTVYALLIMLSIGYVLISRGAKKLQLIEET